MDISIDEIVVDPAIQQRATMNWVVASEYGKLLKSGESLPPIVVFQDENGYWLADGFHRVRGAKDADGVDTIAAEIRQGGKQEALWYAIGANKAHGLRRTNEDKARAVQSALRHPNGASLSNRAIADHVGVDEGTVRRHRDKLEASAEIPQIEERQVTRNGVTYTQDTSNIGQNNGNGQNDEPLPIPNDPEPKPSPPPPPPAETRPMPKLIVGRAEHVPQIGDETIDLIITSPPYNLDSGHWPMGGDGRTPRHDGIGYREHSDKMLLGIYMDWQLDVFREMYRLARPGASFFYNHKPRTKDGELTHPLKWILDDSNPWKLRQEIVWDRGSTHNHAAQLFWPHDERIYWMTKGKPRLPDRPIGMPTVWSFHGPVANTWHPAPFSEELPARCLRALGRPGIVVLDPFAGSCATLKAASKAGYKSIGVDISRSYLERAAQENGWETINESVD